MTTGARAPGRPVPGPEDRETFFAAQPRHRFFMIPMCLIPLVGIPHLLLRAMLPWLMGR